ncbi:hypothetical protein PBI_SCTP2_494 [Salicola phage SCTP-2]|nr:hypothetical protein PBI_SCTP2_494 [Salicola phage SCTP-2]
MSNKQNFEAMTDIIIQYEVDHDITTQALRNASGEGHPQALDIITEEVNKALVNIENRINNEVEGCEYTDCLDLSVNGDATDGF